MPAMKIRKGDLVQVLSGKDRGKQGRVIDARPNEGRSATPTAWAARRWRPAG